MTHSFPTRRSSYLSRWGRRPVLVVAVAVFAAAGTAMVFSPSIEVLIALRVLQGFSGAGSIVIARAIAADLSTGSTAVRALSIIALVTALGPLVAPPLGGAVDAVAGWRGVLAVLAGDGILMPLRTGALRDKGCRDVYVLGVP